MANHIEEKFEEYHEKNPFVYDLFKDFAEEVRQAGFTKYSANAIFERIRWYVDVQSTRDAFKMNNNYRAYYARKLMEEDQRFENFFEIRNLHK